MPKSEVPFFRKIDENRIYAFLSYIFFLCVIPLIYRKDDPFVQSHARQGLALFLCEVAVLLLTILIPLLARPLWFACFLLAFWGMLMALKGRQVTLPFIAALSERIVL